MIQPQVPPQPTIQHPQVPPQPTIQHPPRKYTRYLDYDPWFFCSSPNYIELRGGDGYSYGNVYAVNSNGYFGPVCDDDWGVEEADVVCRFKETFFNFDLQILFLDN